MTKWLYIYFDDKVAIYIYFDDKVASTAGFLIEEIFGIRVYTSICYSGGCHTTALLSGAGLPLFFYYLTSVALRPPFIPSRLLLGGRLL